MNENKKLKITLLVIIATLIWGYTSYSFFTDTPRKYSKKKLQKKNKIYSIAKLKRYAEKLQDKKQKMPVYTLKDSSTDPFKGYNIIMLSSKPQREEKQKSKAPVQTQLKLLGILWDDIKPYALVAHSGGKSFDVTIDQIVEGEKIIKINQESIITERENVQFLITQSGFKILKK